MKVTICDPCKKVDNKTTETIRYMRVKGKPMLRLDICDEHGKEINKMNMIEYARYVYKMNGFSLEDKTDAEVRQFALA